MKRGVCSLAIMSLGRDKIRRTFANATVIVHGDGVNTPGREIIRERNPHIPALPSASVSPCAIHTIASAKSLRTAGVPADAFSPSASMAEGG